MNYQESVEYLYSCLPSLDKKGWGAYKPGLDRVHSMLSLLNNPDKSFEVIHIAGTNGKGSVSHMLASVLQESGLKVGLFTSPHLKDFRERIKVNGQEVGEKEVVDFIQFFSKQAEKISPSFFEYSFALAVNYFNQQKVDVAVIETGLGGRLDCTNVVNPILSVITNVSLDHERFLGSTISAIAAEKGGIIKNGVPVVIGREQEETKPVFDKIAKECNSAVHYSSNQLATYQSDLKGLYQLENQKTVLEIVSQLKKSKLKISDKHLKAGLMKVAINTGLKGRWQNLSNNPKVICDVGHNVDGVRELMKQVANESASSVKVVWGMSEDKDIKKILSLLPTEYQYYWCSADNPRALSQNELKKEAAKIGLKGNSYDDVTSAYNAAHEASQEDDMIFIGGSVFVVAELV